MAQTPDRFPGDREETGLVISSDNLSDAEGQIRYLTGRFSLYDSSGEFDPRSGGSGISETQHEALDRLTHQINESSFDQVVYNGPLVSVIITWASAAMLLKIREELYSYTSGKVSQSITIQYDITGVEKERLTEVYTYSGNRVTSITRTKA